MGAVPDAVVRGMGRSAEPSDAEAITRSQQVPELFSLIFDRYFGQVHGYVARRLADSLADDVAAETFLIAFRERGQYDVTRGPVRAWLYGIATNLIRRHRRHEVRSYRALTRIEVVTRADSHEQRVAERVSVAGMRRQLAGALAELSPGDRDVLLLVALADLTYEEVAAALGIAYGTVCSRLSRARREVRKALGKANPITEEGIDHG
jgi:RNA polymerase sigma factor (sigma-70 family)